jgi:hypothetical protein
MRSWIERNGCDRCGFVEGYNQDMLQMAGRSAIGDAKNGIWAASTNVYQCSLRYSPVMGASNAPTK